MTLSPKLGVVGISTLWHFRLPLQIQMFIKVASSPRLSGIGMPSSILWSHPLKMQRIVWLSSLLWWELGANSQITGPGEWLSFRVSSVNYPDPDPDHKYACMNYYLHSQTIIIAIDEPIFGLLRFIHQRKIYFKSPTLQNGLKVTDECQWWVNIN